MHLWSLVACIGEKPPVFIVAPAHTIPHDYAPWDTVPERWNFRRSTVDLAQGPTSPTPPEASS